MTQDRDKFLALMKHVLSNIMPAKDDTKTAFGLELDAGVRVQKVQDLESLLVYFGIHITVKELRQVVVGDDYKKERNLMGIVGAYFKVASGVRLIRYVLITCLTT